MLANFPDRRSCYQAKHLGIRLKDFRKPQEQSK